LTLLQYTSFEILKQWVKNNNGYLGEMRSESEFDLSFIIEPSCRSPRCEAIAMETGGLIMFTGLSGIKGASGPIAYG
jgi:hypothetical protein